MENILLPSKMSFTDGEKENESTLTIEPLHHGYGTTVGNALRRVLLSSLEGAAVTAVKIENAQHEFSAIEGVKEDVLQIILNLKKLRLKVFSDEKIILKLDVSKEGVAKGSDIEKNADVEIVNPEHVIAHVTSSKPGLKMEITVGRGRGFDPTEERDNSGNVLGTIAVDAMYSPIIGVSVTVENTRVGEITNYDKVIMNILTDGTITVQEAVKDSVNILLSHFNWIDSQLDNATLTEKINAARLDKEEQERKEQEKLAKKVEEEKKETEEE